MLGLFKKIAFVTNPLSSLAESMLRIEKAYENIVNKQPDQYKDNDFITQVGLKMLQKKALEAAIEIVISKTKISEPDDAIDYLIENYPNSYNIWSINTNFNIQSTIQNCMQVYQAKYGENAETQLDTDLQKIYPSLAKQYLA